MSSAITTAEDFDKRIAELKTIYDTYVAAAPNLKFILDGYKDFINKLKEDTIPLNEYADSVYTYKYNPSPTQEERDENYRLNDLQRDYKDKISQLINSYSTIPLIRNVKFSELNVINEYIEKLPVYEKEALAAINNYNEIADLIHYNTRLSLGTAEYIEEAEYNVVKNDDGKFDIVFTDARSYDEDEIVKTIDSEELANEEAARLNFLLTVGIDEKDLDDYEQISAHTGDRYGWFPSTC